MYKDLPELPVKSVPAGNLRTFLRCGLSQFVGGTWWCRSKICVALGCEDIALSGQSHCEELSVVEVAIDVDEITPYKGDRPLFWDQGNWQSPFH